MGYRARPRVSRSIYAARPKSSLASPPLLGSMPWTRLVESVICRRHAGDVVAGSVIRLSWEKMFLDILLIGGKGGSTAEARCKGDVVQAEMAVL